MIAERSGSRKFERVTRWNVLDYTLISRKSSFVPYADDQNSNNAKLCLTRFRFGTGWEPYRKYNIVDKPVILEDGSVLSKVREDGVFWLEINSSRDKVRLYKEVA